jgi:hypothetical protein
MNPTLRHKKEAPYPCAILPNDDRWKLWCRLVPNSWAKLDDTDWMHPDDLALNSNLQYASSVIVGIILREGICVPVEYIFGGNIPPNVAVNLNWIT